MLYFTDDVLEHIVTETNRNFCAKHENDPDGNKMKFEELTVDELKTFIGVMISIGLVQMRGRLKYLWSNCHRMIFMPGIGVVFPGDRFIQIIRYLHFFLEKNAQIGIPLLIMTYIIRLDICLMQLGQNFRKCINQSVNYLLTKA